MTFFRIKHNKNKKKEDRYYAYICRTFRVKEGKDYPIHKEDLKLGRINQPITISNAVAQFPDYELQIRTYFEKRSGKRQLEAAEKGLKSAKEHLQKGIDSLKDRSS